VSLTLRILGSSASRPTVERNVSSIALIREGETLLFDCGEGTQRQMMRYRISFAFGDVFFSHLHADHALGIVGLLRTMSLQGHEAPVRLWGPRGTTRFVRQSEALGGERLTFPLEITELTGEERITRKGYEIVPYPVEHRGAPSLGYALVEEERRGRFHPEMARELGVPEGPLWGELHRGRIITLDDGRVIDPSTLVGPVRSGRKVVIAGDTRPCAATIEAAANADLLVHESTFGHEEAARARETGHSTAREAAEVASRAGVLRLVLTHFSARYSRDTGELEAEARSVFPATIAARDGMEIDVPYRDQSSGAEQSLPGAS
jgi:ribonuclease Z